MSRVAKLPVVIPSGVEVTINNGEIAIKGSAGNLSVAENPLVTITQEAGVLKFAPADESREANALAGTLRQLVNNSVVGLTKGFEKKLTLIGVGYKAAVNGRKLNLSVGFSHPVDFDLPEGVTAATPTPTEILLKGADKQVLGQFAAVVRAVRPPEPYKGKGIRYADERVIIKETKKK
ncbi:large subunit ribosomal protein L6 [Lampropedia hyalina DSM 16112]|jgi:large subunit ribosomal protein L6|uniref:Large ribosomal subunit protein uL6 n=1 Tax=Lampropedia hyalina DSM 16112 TaxID=1122156 RepID=A0A1M5A2C1_9BURK|nr:50S ribosomal protein L6 [Lampropedia hyalina]SHF24449.1 large subunit ribosomal protein L6 [Lampropedia hyalina DSM 16112]